MTENIHLTEKQHTLLQQKLNKNATKSSSEISQTIEKLKSKRNDFKYAFEERNDMSNFSELVPHPKRVYEFELDTFQKQAIYHMELGEHVFVIAHTSAGKTATAEYAIAMAQQKGMKAIYTSPIKALSNQKYYDFRKVFGKVGIITGDVRIESDDDIVKIMTTEILRSKLYQDMKFIDNVDWVIFDEVHYVNDEERGVVWEEVIMSVPKHVKLLMLSATVENAMNFAEWIGRTKNQRVCIVKTLYRPVPLEHFVFKKGKKNVPHKLVTFKKGEQKFYDREYQEIYNEIVPKFGNGNQKHGSPQHAAEEVKKFIEYLGEADKLPAVFFIFSRKRVMEYAQKLAKLSNFAPNSRKINMLFSEMTGGLIESERNLPQITEVRNLLMKGIGVHHAGLIPFLKEIVEVLFSQGDIKVLFATETFAMGVNMPAKTVIFPSVEKFDGKENRFLLAGEYTQMAGRAGRRGKDKFGNVIVFPNKVLPTPTQMREISCGAPAKMQSQFYITYWMMLNWISFGGEELTDQMMKSYSKIDLFQMSQMAKIAQEAKDKFITMGMTGCSDPNCDHEMLNMMRMQIYEVKKEIVRVQTQAQFDKQAKGQNFNVNGRVIKFRSQSGRIEYGMILEASDNYSTHVFFFDGMDKTKPSSETVSYTNIQTIYEKVFKRKGNVPYNESECFVKNDIKMQLFDRIRSFIQNKKKEKRFEPYPSEKLRPIQYRQLMITFEGLKQQKRALPAYNCRANRETTQEDKELKELEKIANDTIHLFQESKENLNRELTKRTQILKTFGFINNDNVLTIKGQVAKEMVSSDGMILTNMLFDGILNQLAIHEMAAIFSVFVFEPSNESQEDLIEGFKPETKQLMQLISDYANKIVAEEEIEQTEYTIEKYVKMNYGLMEGISLWAMKKPFDEVISASSTTEGLIIRCVLRIEQVCEEVTRAAEIVGNEELKNKCLELSDLLKRDIVNVKSLYLRETDVIEGHQGMKAFQNIVVDTNEDLEVTSGKNEGEIDLDNDENDDEEMKQNNYNDEELEISFEDDDNNDNDNDIEVNEDDEILEIEDENDNNNLNNNNEEEEEIEMDF